MVERFRIYEEVGYQEVERQISILKENNYSIIRVEKCNIPFCSGKDGLPVLLPGWVILAEQPYNFDKVRGLGLIDILCVFTPLFFQRRKFVRTEFSVPF